MDYSNSKQQRFEKWLDDRGCVFVYDATTHAIVLRSGGGLLRISDKFNLGVAVADILDDPVCGKELTHSETETLIRDSALACMGWEDLPCDWVNDNRDVAADIDEFLSCFGFRGHDIERKKYIGLFKRWWSQVGELLFRYGARVYPEGMLVLEAPKYINLHAVVDAFSPESGYLKGIIRRIYDFDPDNGDHVAVATSAGITEICDMDEMSDERIARIAEFVVRDCDVCDNLVMDTGVEVRTRHTSFVGTVRDASKFKGDPRFWVVRLATVDFDKLSELDLRSVWRWAANECSEGHGHHMTALDRAEICGSGAGLLKAFQWGAPTSEWTYRPAAVVLDEIQYALGIADMRLYNEQLREIMLLLNRLIDAHEIVTHKGFSHNGLQVDEYLLPPVRTTRS